MEQSICGMETAEKNRDKATVTGEEKDWLNGGEIWKMCRWGYKVREDSRADSVEYL